MLENQLFVSNNIEQKHKFFQFWGEKNRCYLKPWGCVKVNSLTYGKKHPTYTPSRFLPH